MPRSLLLAIAFLGAACSRRPPPSSRADAPVTVSRQASGPGPVVISIVGTNDLHGHLEMLPFLAGYLGNLRSAREADGAMVLLDAGDMFQGTLESNLAEGAPVVAAYNALGYQAAAIGNHEFDYGPVGPASTPQSASDDPRGALRALAAAARFPFLTTNIVGTATGERVSWPNVLPSTVITAAGIRIAVIGATTESTPRTTIAGNFRGLAMTGIVPAVTAEAARLRAAGTAAVIVVAHAGGSCRVLRDASDLSSCNPTDEIFEIARALPPGAVDVIVAGHTHAGVAHRISGIAVIESFAQGRAFGRVDLSFDRATMRITGVRVHPPQDVCTHPVDGAHSCVVHARYEGRPVVRDESIARTIAPAFESARAQRQQRLGVTVETAVRRSYGSESALGNLVSDLMREAWPGADVAIVNGGGLRADLDPGELTYGALYEALPFDNRLVSLRITGERLRRLVATNLTHEGSIISVSGIRARAVCVAGQLEVRVFRSNGTLLPDEAELTVVTSDFLATGGEGLFAGLPPGPAAADRGVALRDAVAERLRAHGGTIHGESDVFTESNPRLAYPGRRPALCRH